MRWGIQARTHSLTHTVTAEWLIHVEIFCFLLFLYVFLGCSVRHTDMYWMYFGQSLAVLLGEKMSHWLQSFITAEASALLRNSEREPQQWGRNHNSSKIQQLCPENFTCENIAVIPVTDWLPATTMQCSSAYTAVIVEETYESLHGWSSRFFICYGNKEPWLSLASSESFIGKDTESKVSPV